VLARTVHDEPVARDPLRSDDGGWVVLTEPTRSPRGARPTSARRVYAQVVLLTALALALVIGVGTWMSNREAEREGVQSAARRTTLLADVVVQPALTDGVLTGDPDALAALDLEVRQHVLPNSVVRVKLWAADGRILYSDEARLIGQQYQLDDEELDLLRDAERGADTETGAEISDLGEPENVYERGEGKLLEVYLPVQTPDGTSVLLETYTSYDSVEQRGHDIWRAFLVITIVSLLALLLLMMPVIWRLLVQLRHGQEQRERLLQRALSASDAERRRIAATLHDGPVQELAATSYVLSGAKQRVEPDRQPELAGALDDAARVVRSSIGGLRSLLVDIYPASLTETGVEQALADLVASLQPRDVEIRLEAEPGVGSALTREQAQLIFQIAQETLRNAVRHSGADRVDVVLVRPDGFIRLDVVDDGAGFDVGAALADPETGHFGLRLMTDAAERAGGGLRVRSAPGEGTAWRLEVLLR
jgi:two-component system, NarL family, sensor kinase